MAVDLRAPPGPTALTRPTGTTRSASPPGRADSAVVTGTRGMTDRWPCPHGMDAPVLARHSPLHNFLYFPTPPTAPTITGPRGDGENPGPVPPDQREGSPAAGGEQDRGHPGRTLDADPRPQSRRPPVRRAAGRAPAEESPAGGAVRDRFRPRRLHWFSCTPISWRACRR